MKRIVWIAALSCAAWLPPVNAVTLGQIDTFSGSVQGWVAGGGPPGSTPPVPPQVIAGGGPGGAGDSFLQVTAGGGVGPGSRLVAMNVLGQWSGDYLGAGVSAIAMDLRNLGSTDLTIRLLFEDPIPNPPQNLAATLTGWTLAAGGGWQHVVFPILPADLQALQGNVTAALTGTTVLRLFHSPTVAFPPETVVGLLGVDNIQAVPEPAGVVMMGLGLFTLLLLRGRRER